MKFYLKQKRIKMKGLLTLFITTYLLVTHANATKVISCGDAFKMKKNSEAKYYLHKLAQERAQSQAEDFMNKKITNPFPTMSLNKPKGTLERIIPLIEIYWCKTMDTPLHSAYYYFYMSNKIVWK